MTATSDPAVDELKRRARRRLIGAVVLALAAAVSIPLLLESEPKPLGDDVSIQIPPIDNGKFVNPLSSGKTADVKGRPQVKAEAPASVAPAASAAPTPSEPNADGVTVPKDGVTAAERRVLGQAPMANPPRMPAVASTDANSPPASAESASASPAPVAPATQVASVEPGKAGAFAIQLAAFADAKAANDLAAKLKAAGFAGYVEPLATDKGPMQRVRAGPYASRADADAALRKLKAAGFSGVVSPAK